MKRLFATAALTSVALALAACQPAESTMVKIGIIAPLTGDAAAIGADFLNGAKLAADTVNAAGGIDGEQVELVVEDGRCSGQEAANAAQKLVNVDKVTVIVGGFCSGETLAAAPIAEAGKVPLMSPGSSSPDITTAGEFIFRDYPSDALKTKAMAKIFADKGWKKVALLTENTDFAMAFRESLKKDVGADAFIFDEVVEPGTKDVRSVLTRLKGVQFDVFFPNGNSDGVIGPMVQQFREQGFTQAIISHDAADSTTMGTNAKEAVEGMSVVNVPAAGEGTPFQTEFEAKYGKAQTSLAFAAHTYDAVTLFAKIIGEHGTDGPAIRDALLALPSYEGIIGTFHFDENGDVVGVPYVLKEFKDGVTVKVVDVPVQ